MGKLWDTMKRPKIEEEDHNESIENTLNKTTEHFLNPEKKMPI